MIQVKIKFPFKAITFEQGKLYYFSYRKYEQDPTPFIIFVNFLRGTNPTTGSFWNFIQAINLHYITKPSRIRLIKALEYWSKNKRKVQFNKLFFIPGVEFAIRRYIASASYLNRIKEIDNGIVEIKKAKHARLYLPKGVKYADLMSRRMKPNSLKKRRKKRGRRR